MDPKFLVDMLDKVKRISENYLHKQEQMNKNSEIKAHYILLFLMKLMPYASKEVCLLIQDHK